MSLMDKIFGSYSKKELKRVRPTVDKILALEEKTLEIEKTVLD